jgi:Fe-S cluster assembly iron-binding protein IscA
VITISRDAARLIGEIVEGSALPDGAGMRISAQPGEEVGQAVLRFGLIEGPTGTDEIVEHFEARVFVERDAAPYVRDKVLHAEVEGDKLNLVLAPGPSLDLPPDDPGMSL